MLRNFYKCLRPKYFKITFTIIVITFLTTLLHINNALKHDRTNSVISSVISTNLQKSLLNQISKNQHYVSHDWIFNSKVSQYSSTIRIFNNTVHLEALVFINDDEIKYDDLNENLVCLILVNNLTLRRASVNNIIKIALMPTDPWRTSLYRINCKYDHEFNLGLNDIKFAVLDKYSLLDQENHSNVNYLWYYYKLFIDKLFILKILKVCQLASALLSCL